MKSSKQQNLPSLKVLMLACTASLTLSAAAIVPTGMPDSIVVQWKGLLMSPWVMRNPIVKSSLYWALVRSLIIPMVDLLLARGHLNPKYTWNPKHTCMIHLTDLKKDWVCDQIGIRSRLPGIPGSLIPDKYTQNSLQIRFPSRPPPWMVSVLA